MRFLTWLLTASSFLLCLMPVAVHSQTAEYRGRIYTSRVCSSPNCAMCNQIQAQLNAFRWLPVAVKSKAPELRLKVPELVPTPIKVAERMVALVGPKNGELYADLGSGDGRFLEIAATTTQARVVGIEISSSSIQKSNERLAVAGVASRVAIVQSDMLKVDLSKFDCVTMYLYPELMEKVMPQLKTGCRVASYLHPIPGLDAIKVDDIYYGIK